MRDAIRSCEQPAKSLHEKGGNSHVVCHGQYSAKLLGYMIYDDISYIYMYTLLYTYIAVSHLIYLLVKRNMNVVHNSLASNKQTSVENPSIKPLTSIKAFYQYHQEPPERQRYCQANQRHKVTVYNHTSAKTYTSLYYILYFPDMNLLSMFGSYGIPMGFLWDSYGIPMGFLWIEVTRSYGSQAFPSVARLGWAREGIPGLTGEVVTACLHLPQDLPDEIGPWRSLET